MAWNWCHEEYDDGCSLCRRLKARPELRAAHAAVPPIGGTAVGPVGAIPFVLPRCPHLGAKLPGQPCGGPLHRCDLDGVTCSRVSPCKDAVRVCESCTLRPDRPTYPAVRRRHLVYHLLPVAGNGVWQRGVDALRHRWPLFTGRRVISVVTGGPVAEQGTGRKLTLDPPNAVRAYLPPDCEVIEAPNDPDRWELVSWSRLWDRVLSEARDDDAVLYAHAKGATRPAGSTCHRWAELLYTLSLDHWPTVAELLTHHPVVGGLKKVGWKFNDLLAASRWHFAGNFWWVRAGEMRAKLAAVPVPADRWATEAWVGIAWRPWEAGTFGPALQSGTSGDLYKQETWVTLGPATLAWQTANPPRPASAAEPLRKTLPSRQDGIRLSIVVAHAPELPGRRETLLRALASLTPQLGPGDEILVQADDSRDWGATPRTAGMKRAKGTHILFRDDDDADVPGSLDVIRKALVENPGKPHLFSMRREGGVNDVLPKSPHVYCGNVSTQMVAVPNDPDRLGSWGVRYEGDFDFISTTLAKYPPDSVVFRPEVVAVWRPVPTKGG